MKKYSFEDVREIILDIIEPKIVKAGLDKKNISNETDLLITGILDSFDFIDLVCAVEDNTGLTVDFTRADSKSFTTLEGLITEIIN